MSWKLTMFIMYIHQDEEEFASLHGRSLRETESQAVNLWETGDALEAFCTLCHQKDQRKAFPIPMGLRLWGS